MELIFLFVVSLEIGTTLPLYNHRNCINRLELVC